MPLAVLARSFALLFLALPWSTSALARTETYEGTLIPDGRESPIPIVLEMEDLGGFLTGSVKVASPLNANAPIQNGRNVAGSCNLNSMLGNKLTLRLFGSCSATVFEGHYTIVSPQSRAPARAGTFRVTRKVQVSDKNIDAIAAPGMTASACLKSNAHCLAACPRDDTDIEYLCSNRCRKKLQTCKGQVGKQNATAASQ